MKKIRKWLYILTFAGLPSFVLTGQVPVANLYLDFNTKISINGVSELDREKHFNIHESSMDFEFNYLRHTLDVHVGRQTGEITSSLLKNVKEDPANPGNPNWPYLEGYSKSLLSADLRSVILRQLVTDNLIMSSHTEHFLPNPLNPTTYPFIPPASHSQAAEILMNYLAWRYPENNRRYKYIEPLNEPNIKLSDLGVSWDKVIDFHAVIADSVHRRFGGEILAGGAGSAWPAFQRYDFRIYTDGFGRFIDRAGQKMDFLSIHLYDTHHDLGGRTTLYRIGANTSAILNLLENHSLILLGEVKPFVISEYGGGFKTGLSSFDEGMPYHPFMNWFTMKGVNGKLMEFLDRPDRMFKTVPFIVGNAPWFYNLPRNPDNNPYPWVLVLPANPSRTAWKFSHNIKFYEFWREVAGSRIETESDHPDVQVQAFRNGRQVYWIINNLVDSSVQLAWQIENQDMLSGTRLRRLFMQADSVPVLTESTLDTLSGFELGPSEIVCLLAEAPDSSFAQEKNWKRIYGTQNLLPISGNTPVSIPFQSIHADPAQADTAILEFSYGRLSTAAKFPSWIILNGDTLDVPDNWAGPEYDSQEDFFTSLKVGVPPGTLKPGEGNELTVVFSDNGGRIGSANLDIRYVTPLTSVTFHTYYRDGKDTDTLANAKIAFGDMVVRSGADGTITIRVPEGNYNYIISKEGHISLIDSLVVGQDTMVQSDTLEVIRSQVEIFVVDGQTSEPVRNASLTWDGMPVPVDSNGYAVTQGVLSSGYRVSLSAPDYQEIQDELLEISSDTVIRIELLRRLYEIGFLVSDIYTGAPVPDVIISTETYQKSTNGSGFAMFYLQSGDYHFTFEKEKYRMLEDTTRVLADTTLEFSMQRYLADVKFRVYSGGSSVSNALITVGDRTGLTNLVGIRYFYDLGTDTSYIYTVTLDGYDIYMDSINLRTDTTLNVDLHGTFVNKSNGGTGFRIYPNPAGDAILLEGYSGSEELLYLIDSRGVELGRYKFIHGRQFVDISFLDNGVYYIYNPETKKSVRFIKQ